MRERKDVIYGDLSASNFELEKMEYKYLPSTPKREINSSVLGLISYQGIW